LPKRGLEPLIRKVQLLQKKEKRKKKTPDHQGAAQRGLSPRPRISQKKPDFWKIEEE